MSAEENSPAPAGRRILVIDDQRDIAHLFRVMLTRLGHEVRVAQDGASAIELAREYRPEIIFCDILMEGGMDGYEVAQALRKQTESSAAYLVAMTGHGEERDRQAALAAGFDLHATKPLDFDKLQQMIAAAPARG